MPAAYRAAILTISDSVAQGTRQDISGPAVRGILEKADWTVGSAEVLPDDFTLIRERLEALTVNAGFDAVFTTGGTGLGPRDRTPEATTSVMERSLPGVAELMRREGLKKTPRAVLSRAVAGLKAKTLIINLPGSPEGAEDSLRAILEVLPHAVDVVRGEVNHSQTNTAEAVGAAPDATRAEFVPAVSSEASSPPADESVGESEESVGDGAEGVGNGETV